MDSILKVPDKKCLNYQVKMVNTVSLGHNPEFSKLLAEPLVHCSPHSPKWTLLLYYSTPQKSSLFVCA